MSDPLAGYTPEELELTVNVGAIPRCTMRHFLLTRQKFADQPECLEKFEGYSVEVKPGHCVFVPPGCDFKSGTVARRKHD